MLKYRYGGVDVHFSKKYKKLLECNSDVKSFFCAQSALVHCTLVRIMIAIKSFLCCFESRIAMHTVCCFDSVTVLNIIKAGNFSILILIIYMNFAYHVLHICLLSTPYSVIKVF